MTRVIHKWPVPGAPGEFDLELPKLAQVVSFGEDVEHQLCLWACVQPEAELVHRRFWLVFTGEKFNLPETAHPGLPKASYLGHAVHRCLVWHLLELDPPCFAAHPTPAAGQELR